MKLHTVRLNSAKDFQDFMHLLASELTGASQKPKADPAERLREQLVAKGGVYSGLPTSKPEKETFQRSEQKPCCCFYEGRL